MQFTNAELYIIKFALQAIGDDKDMPLISCEAKEILNKIRLHQQVEITQDAIAKLMLQEHSVAPQMTSK